MQNFQDGDILHAADLNQIVTNIEQKADKSEVYTRTEIDTKLDDKAEKPGEWIDLPHAEYNVQMESGDYLQARRDPDFVDVIGEFTLLINTTTSSNIALQPVQSIPASYRPKTTGTNPHVGTLTLNESIGLRHQVEVLYQLAPNRLIIPPNPGFPSAPIRVRLNCRWATQ